MWMILALSLGILILPSFVAITWLSAGVYLCWAIGTLYVVSLGVAFFLRYRQGKWESMRVIDIPVVG